MPTPQQRERYIAIQKEVMKQKTNMVIRKIKDERFEIEDDCKAYSQAFYNDLDISVGLAATVATRKKIHQISYEALKKIRNCNDDVDLDRLARLIRIHKTQLRKLRPNDCESNLKFYDEMIESITQNLSWLKILNKS